MSNTITCSACQQEQSTGGDFCSFCYVAFADAPPQVEDQNEALPLKSLYRPADFLSPEDKLAEPPPLPSRNTFSPPSSGSPYKPAEIVKENARQAAILKNLPLRLLFCYQAISPLVWFGLFILAIIGIFISLIELIPDSFPYYLGLPFGILTAVSLNLFYAKIYPLLAAEHEGGFMAPVQKTILSLGPFSLILAGWYLLHFSAILGWSIILLAGGYFFIFQISQRSLDGERKNLLDSFLDLANTTQRIEKPGIDWVEKASLAAIFMLFLFGLALAVDRVIPLSYKEYPVKILGKEVHHGGKGGPTYSLTLSGWQSPRKIIYLRINQTTYQRLIPGRNYRFKTRQGLLGGERIQSFQAAPRQD